LKKCDFLTQKLGIKKDPDPKLFIPDPDPSKSSGSGSGSTTLLVDLEQPTSFFDCVKKKKQVRQQLFTLNVISQKKTINFVFFFRRILFCRCVRYALYFLTRDSRYMNVGSSATISTTSWIPDGK
jgi:hypothetical protein